MCDDCRVNFVAEQGFESYGAPSPTTRTTDDYRHDSDPQPPRGSNRD
jgi:hypothetical protein